jgi:hypothetical protein
MMIRGLGIGALICSIFGCIWMLAAISFIDNERINLLPKVALGFGVLLIASAVPIIAMPAKKQPKSDAWTRRAKRLQIVNAVQWSSIAAAILLLNITHRVALIPWVISVIVGIHFLPWGAILRLTSYQLLGAAILALDLAALILPSETHRAFVAAGTGLALFCASCYWVLKAWIACSRHAPLHTGANQSSEGV